MKRIAAVVCLLAAAVTAHGAEGSVGLGATAKIGTLGYGGELTIGLGPYLGLRGGYYTMDPEISYNADVGDVDITLDWQTIPLLLDVHPFGGGFRVSGGVVLNDNQVLAASEPGTELEFDGLPFTVERFDGSVTFDDQSYYFGIGYGNAVGAGGRWNFSCDIGLMYHGEPQLNASAVSSEPALQGALDAALDNELEDAQDDVKDFKFYPVVAVGLSFRI